MERDVTTLYREIDGLIAAGTGSAAPAAKVPA
jgi:hypothetical protein